MLEKKHEDVLRDEWDRVEGLSDKILTRYPIKSVPPEDRVRFSTSERLRNLSRKKIMEQLVNSVGEPKGVPGFYQRADGSWTFYRLCGIAFPVFNAVGQIVRIRIGDDYPAVLKQEDGVTVGKYQYMARAEGTGWYYIPSVKAGDDIKFDYSNIELVWSDSVKKITLSKRGYPQGKVNGKYKNFSSYQEKEVEEDGMTKLVNQYTNGCQSGSHISLYADEEDDWAVVYITEGEKKALVANSLLGVPVISMPGAGSFSKVFDPEENREESMFEQLCRKGARLFVIVFDADKKQNAWVLKQEDKAKSLVKTQMANGIQFAIGEWNAQWGKGLDDILLASVMPQIHLVA